MESLQVTCAREERMARIVPVFLTKARADLRYARHELDLGRLDGVQPVAHQLKGAGSTLGFPQVTAWSRALLEALEDSDRERCSNLLSELEFHVEEQLCRLPAAS